MQNPPPIGRATLAYRWDPLRRPLRWSSFGAVAFGLPLNKETLLGGFSTPQGWPSIRAWPYQVPWPFKWDIE